MHASEDTSVPCNRRLFADTVPPKPTEEKQLAPFARVLCVKASTTPAMSRSRFRAKGAFKGTRRTAHIPVPDPRGFSISSDVADWIRTCVAVQRMPRESYAQAIKTRKQMRSEIQRVLKRRALQAFKFRIGAMHLIDDDDDSDSECDDPAAKHRDIENCVH